MAQLIGRVARVVVVERPTGFVGNNPQFFERIGNALEIDKLRIRFEVSKGLGKEPNKTTIKISNLAEHTRTELERGKPLGVTLYAGYQNVYQLIAAGDLSRAFSIREGRTDIVTTLRVSDGLRAYQKGRMQRSYKPPIVALRVLEDAAKSLGLTLPPELEQSSELKQAIEGGISMHGQTRDVLTRLLAPYGYGWSIQDGRLLILKDDDLRPGEEFLVDAESGLVGIPERTYPEKAGGKSEVKFQTLLDPRIKSGSAVRLRSQLLNLSMKVTDVQHVGDTGSGGEMKTSVNGKPLT